MNDVEMTYPAEDVLLTADLCLNAGMITNADVRLLRDSLRGAAIPLKKTRRVAWVRLTVLAAHTQLLADGMDY